MVVEPKILNFSNTLIGTLMFVRDINSLYTRLYGESLTRIKGKPPRINFEELEGIQTYVEVGPGISVYPYQIAQLLSREGEKRVELILVEPEESVRKFHQTYVEKGFSSASDYFEKTYGIKVPRELYELKQIDTSRFDVIIQEGRVEEGIPCGDLVIASYVFPYLETTEDVCRGIENVYKSSGLFGIIVSLRDRINRAVKGFIRRECYVYSNWEDKKGVELTSFIKEMDESYGKKGALFLAHSKRMVLDPLDMRYEWENLNLIISNKNLIRHRFLAWLRLRS